MTSDNKHNMTVEICLQYAYNYTYVGLQNGTDCLFGSNINSTIMLDPNQSDCATACAGNATEVCGGNGLITLYKLKSAP
ncbi:MAG: hypothetical protein M1829_003589 [Trizodia sp. TS-e1964]|nr:MAG: hypothetical protein M1829_003589 [Trizodia sp. TS-e1964]